MRSTWSVRPNAVQANDGQSRRARLGISHWSARFLAAELGMSFASVARIWRRVGYPAAPDPGVRVRHRRPGWSSRSRRSVALLDRDPPANAVVVSVDDEKSQIQALDRTAPMLPLRPGLAERRTHDYKRNGTTTLFATLEVATGKITADACYPRHRHQEFLRFLKKVAAAHPGVELHVVLDNYGTHKHPESAAWLAEPASQRITLHFTPTGCSWLNMVEIFFGIITRQAIRRGTFRTVKDLTSAIGRFIDAYNQRCQPFTWTKDADELIAKLRPSKSDRQRTSATRH